MAKDVIMPALGMAQETGTLLQWLKSAGDEVTKGEPIMEIETDKATVEIEAPASGTLANVTAGPGDIIPVGQVIALILSPGETAPQPSQTSQGDAVAETAPPSTPAILASPVAARIAAEHNIDLNQVETTGSRIQKEDVLAYLQKQGSGPSTRSGIGAGEQGSGNGRVLASPKARRLAREQGLDLAALDGSGPEGAVLAADVMAAAAAIQTAEPAKPIAAAPLPVTAAETIPVSRMWRVMAQRLIESWNTVPHFYLEREANASQLLAWWEGVKQRVSEKVTLTDLLVKLVAVALGKHPRLNAMWQNDSLVQNHDINVGLAVAVEEGLLVPVIHQADQLGLAGLAERRQEIVGRARSGKVSLDDLQGGTFTISNLGMYGVDSFNAIVNPPQAAILAVGRIADKVVPHNGQPVIQPMMSMTLSCDHRVVDGARGAQFLQTLVSFVEDPLGVLD